MQTKALGGSVSSRTLPSFPRPHCCCSLKSTDRMSEAYYAGESAEHQQNAAALAKEQECSQKWLLLKLRPKTEVGSLLLMYVLMLSLIMKGKKYYSFHVNYQPALLLLKLVGGIQHPKILLIYDWTIYYLSNVHSHHTSHGTPGLNRSQYFFPS